MPSQNNILKRLEIALRQKIIKFLSYNSKTGSERIHIEQAGDYFDFRDNCKILLLRQDRIGDVIISSPVIRILCSKFPNAQIDILLGNKNFGARHGIGKYIDNVFLYDRNILKSLLLIRKLRRQNYDLIIDLFDNASATSSLFIKLVKSRYKLGIFKENEYVYSHTVAKPDKQKHHIVERTAALLMAFGIDPSEQNLSLDYEFSKQEIAAAKEKMQPGGFLVGVNLAGSVRRRFWGVDNNIALIKMISDYIPDGDIRVFATEDYGKELEVICSETNSTPSPAADSFHEYAAFLSQCNIIISTDTAAVHVASARHIPCVGLYELSGRLTTGVAWGPYNSPGEIVISPTSDLSDLPPEEVFAAFVRIYQKHPHFASIGRRR